MVAMPTSHDHAELNAWIRLSLEPGLGAADTRRLLAAAGLPQHIFSQPAAALRKLVPDDLARRLAGDADEALAGRIAHALDWASRPGHHIITLADAAYPQRLLDMPDPPPLLYAKGNASLLAQPCLAIVGARSATAGGCDNARAFAGHLAGTGWTIVSGLALGIDAAAHTGALDANGASTIAVLATGIDLVYPARHRDLAHRIADQGLLLSELPLGTRAMPYQFPRRNRLVAGLSHGVLVVEAARQSGSLITARLAAELGREVFAIPGSIHSPLSRGCHALIRQGAKLVESARDIEEELQPVQPALFARPDAAAALTGQAGGTAAVATTGGTTNPTGVIGGTRSADAAEKAIDADAANTIAVAGSDEALVLQALGYDPAHPDVLVRRSGLNAARVTAALTQLELAEHVVRQSDGRYQRR